jgi:hypothetical protein
LPNNSNDFFKTGIGLAVKFDNAGTFIDGKSKITISKESSEEGKGSLWSTSYPMAASLPTGGHYSWIAGETIYFIFDGTYWVISDAGNFSRLT